MWVLSSERKPKTRLNSGHKKRAVTISATAPTNIVAYMNVLLCVMHALHRLSIVLFFKKECL